MWIVRVALSRPYTFVVLALILLIIGPLVISRTPTDIFPDINIPVVSIVWNYNGLPPTEMAQRITSVFERAVTTTVNDIEHIESVSLQSVAVVKLYFHPRTNIDIALSQVTAISQTMLRQMPSGTLPPLILSYNASSVPILQLLLSSNTLSEQVLNDFGNNMLRTQLATVQGASLPLAYGGKMRQIQVDLNLEAMKKYGVSAQDVNAAVNQQNLILPAGTEKIGSLEYIVKLNGSPPTVEELNNLPIKATPQGVLYIRDVAHVRDGFAPQTDIVRVDGARAVMMSVQKTGKSSTLDIVFRVKQILKKMKDNLPEGLKLNRFSDQSIFVSAAIEDVVKEGVIAGVLTGLMILIVLGSWQSTFIITISIPLSILTSLIVLSFLGETMNIMTLGGLALAVGILVDDATVAIENINWNLEQGKDVETAILDGAEQIAIPALVSTLCICIVFIPMFFLSGVAKYLFAPFAEAVIFAMLASYVLSRTLVPTMANYLLHKHGELEQKSFITGIHNRFEHYFDRFRLRYELLLTWVLENSKLFIFYFLGFLLLSIVLITPWLGSNFFPVVDAGQIKLHLRAPTGTRIEETAKLVDRVDKVIRQVIPKHDLDSLVDNIGLPKSGTNLTYSNSGSIGPGDADILISLNEGHRSSNDYIFALRKTLKNKFPGVVFAFLPADIVNQILNFGLPSPISLQIVGNKIQQNRLYANLLMDKMRKVSGLVDIRTRQAYDYPVLNVNVDRSLARELGFTQLEIATNMLIALSGSFQTSPTFWLSPKNGISYPIVTQVPQYLLDSLEALRNIVITSANGGVTPQILGAMATITRGWDAAVESHYNVQPVIDIFASIQDRDLGSVGKQINRILEDTKLVLPKGSSVLIQGQMNTQQQAFSELYFGLLFSIVLVYLLMVINFQSWLDPFIIITALPAALAGIVWMLFLTYTTLSVPALTGAIMCMGVATANGILVISFARQELADGKDPFSAALAAGKTRLRPVLMTATAMIIGMIPMALGIGSAGEQNAPLGRAVIGGLLFATAASLVFIPAVFNLIHGHRWKLNKRANHA